VCGLCPGRSPGAVSRDEATPFAGRSQGVFGGGLADAVGTIFFDTKRYWTSTLNKRDLQVKLTPDDSLKISHSTKHFLNNSAADKSYDRPAGLEKSALWENALCKKYLPMEATTHFNNRLPGRRVTEGSGRAPQPGSYDPARGRSGQIDRALAGIATALTFDLSDVDEVFKRTPNIADLKPAGRFIAKDLSDDDGIPLVVKTLLENGYLHGECVTVTGCSMAGKLRRMARNIQRDANIGGPIGYFDDGGIAIGAECGSLDAQLSDSEFEERPAGRQSAFGSGDPGRFFRQVGTAHHGAVAGPGGSAEKTCYADI
jgi:hypothetical protein